MDLTGLARPPRHRRRPAARDADTTDGPARAASTADQDAPPTSFARARADGDYDHAVETETSRIPGRYPKGAIVRLAIGTAFAFALGWFIAYRGVIPGVFTAADLGMPTLFVLTIRLIVKTMEARIAQAPLRKAAVAVPKGAAWAIGLYWTVITVTNVPMLAYGLAVGILGYAGYSARLQMRTHGHDGLGAGASPAFFVLGGWVVWAVLHQFLGPVPGFTLASIAYGALVAVLAARRADHAAKAAAEAPLQVHHTTTEEEARRASEKRILVGILIAYLVFRLFLSARIPYGPIVEWILICIGMLFFTIIAADRIGVVPTERALPPSRVRRHIQVVSSLPDQRLAETEAQLAAFIDRGADGAALKETFRRLYADLDVPMASAETVLERIDRVADHARHGRRAARTGHTLAERRVLVADACALLRTRPRGGDVTGTLKTGGEVQKRGSVGTAA